MSYGELETFKANWDPLHSIYDEFEAFGGSLQGVKHLQQYNTITKKNHTCSDKINNLEVFPNELGGSGDTLRVFADNSSHSR